METCLTPPPVSTPWDSTTSSSQRQSYLRSHTPSKVIILAQVFPASVRHGDCPDRVGHGTKEARKNEQVGHFFTIVFSVTNPLYVILGLELAKIINTLLLQVDSRVRLCRRCLREKHATIENQQCRPG